MAAFARPSGIWPRMPTFFRHLDAILPWVGLETVTCKALRSGCCSEALRCSRRVEQWIHLLPRWATPAVPLSNPPSCLGTGPMRHTPALRKIENRPGESCGSSVVEHSLGKGEAESSILSRSTSFPFTIRRRKVTERHPRRNAPAPVHKSRSGCNAPVILSVGTC